jgi:hypothetical protein
MYKNGTAGRSSPPGETGSEEIRRSFTKERTGFASGAFVLQADPSPLGSSGAGKNEGTVARRSVEGDQLQRCNEKNFSALCELGNLR